MTNPLLETDGLPRFSEIRPDHIKPAVDQVIADNRAAIAELTEHAGPHDWDSLVAPLERLEDRLEKVWSPVSHLNAVMNSEALREAYNACLPALSAYQTEMGQNTALYQAFRTLRDSDAGARMTADQRQTVDNALRDFELSGVALEDTAKSRYAEISARLAELSSRFQENLLDASDAWTWDTDAAEDLDGIPASALGVMKQKAEQAGVEGWRVSLDMPIVQAVLAHASNRDLRYRVYEAFTTRASDTGPRAGQWDNHPVMAEILDLRQEQAGLLGFSDYAELSLAPKMADSADQVVEFLEDLARRAHPVAEQEYATLVAFARERDGLETLQAWDVGYYSERLREARFELSPEDLRPWFQADRVMAGLFAVVERLFGIRIAERDDVDTWHDDVRFYEIFDADGILRGQFYTDLYARSHKRGGAWMAPARGRMRHGGEAQTPVAFLTCNFTPPVGDQPALITHGEVETLFHEFGHGLHHMLTRVDAASVAGINGVAWDAVELPSQFLENWCWEREALDLFARHHETGEPIPEALFERMTAARNFQAAMQMVRQLEFSLFDLRLHVEHDRHRGERVFELLGEVRDQVAVVRPPAFNRFPNSFAHIFAGGYAAGYYSYKWAEVLSADAFARFTEEGIFNPVTGRSFLESILERGGSEDAATLFSDFRGREPSIEPLLKASGLAA
ncbi:oligopeptidase A [Spiribacter vilamensis]|uniref:oligopeptidase A n=1 Tax=Spiribacter vilamensis TaxID=531306 RepID=A0A4Q8D1P5_9GAMM|nr:oligopeptidase A [Spiribacter vilamensis]RZU99279.1 oligopeptidase A [Spiribacter vilamensis]TVO61737.1 oligopeptidase A [Spiribacter vilamensis]